MRTPRRHRLTRRQSEQMLDGLGEPGDLSRLLADARPLRATGELPGEAAALGAFRSAAVADPDPRPRSSSVRTLSLSRVLAVKVLAIASASVAVGGVALAASGTHLPGTGPAHPVASSTAHPTGTADKDGDRKDPSGRPTALPTGLPGHRDDLRAVGLCRAWSEVTKQLPAAGRTAGADNGKGKGPNTPEAAARAKAFQELIAKAGGASKVAAFCEAQAKTWCENHRWPGSQQLTVDGRDLVIRCVRPTGTPGGLPTGLPTGMPTGRPTGMPTGRPTWLPTDHSGHSGKPTWLPTGAPVSN